MNGSGIIQYEGSSTEDDVKHIPHDHFCPSMAHRDTNRPNTWKKQCLLRQQADMGCYKTKCKHAIGDDLTLRRPTPPAPGSNGSNGISCRVEGCSADVMCKGLCTHHYHKEVNERKKKKICQVPDCPRPYYAKNFCRRHYQSNRKQQLLK